MHEYLHTFSGIWSKIMFYFLSQSGEGAQEQPVDVSQEIWLIVSCALKKD